MNKLMIKPIRILSVLTLGLSVVLLSACFDEGIVSWETEQLAFDVGTDTNPAHTISLEADESEPFIEELTVELAGPQQQGDINAVFEINDSETTAVEGEHFEVVNNGNVAVISAGSSFGQVEIRILSGNFEPGESVEIVPRLTDESDWDIMENFRQYYLTVEKAEMEPEEDE